MRQEKPKGLLWQLVYRPQQTFLRKALFQVHLWTGVVLAVYMFVIGVTGSILVFRNEITAHGYTKEFGLGSTLPSPPQTERVFAAAKTQFPAAALVAFRSPSPRDPVETIYLRRGKVNSIVLLNPISLQPLGTLRAEPKWLVWVRSLHADLLAGKTGRIWNGVGAIALTLLCLTGLGIWWRGLKQAVRGLWVSTRSGWRRINFDLHSMVGFWCLSFLLMWAVTGIAFSWPKQYRNAVASVSPITAVRVPRIVSPMKPIQQEKMIAAIEAAQGESARMVLTGADLPANSRVPLLVYMTKGQAGDLLHTTYLYFDPNTGKQLYSWQRGQPSTFGDWMTWATVPFHYGNYWGMMAKIVWALAGLSLPILSVTGLLMYWNRYLRHAVR